VVLRRVRLPLLYGRPAVEARYLCTRWVTVGRRRSRRWRRRCSGSQSKSAPRVRNILAASCERDHPPDDPTSPRRQDRIRSKPVAKRPRSTDASFANRFDLSQAPANQARRIADRARAGDPDSHPARNSDGPLHGLFRDRMLTERLSALRNADGSMTEGTTRSRGARCRKTFINTQVAFALNGIVQTAPEIKPSDPRARAAEITGAYSPRKRLTLPRRSWVSHRHGCMSIRTGESHLGHLSAEKRRCPMTRGRDVR